MKRIEKKINYENKWIKKHKQNNCLKKEYNELCKIVNNKL